MAPSPQHPDPHRPEPGALAGALISLAGTPEHMAGTGARLVSIAKLTVERVAAAAYASVTALRGREYTTVAVSDDLIRAVDEAQYADAAGPCLDALRSSSPVGVPDIDTTVQWPGFHAAAPRMGLHASVSVPLFAGRGEAIAVLNVYGHDRPAMAPLIAAVCAVHRHPGQETVDDEFLAGLDDGSRELVTGYAEALDVRADIRLAIEFIAADNHCGTDDAYLMLCVEASTTGADLGEVAATLINRYN